MGSKNKKNKAAANGDGEEVEVARGGGNKSHVKKIITDSRFASLHSDPRFREAPKHKAKVAIDSRFDRMFSDKNFANSSARIDKRGRTKKDSSQNPLKHYYRLEEGADKEEAEEIKRREEVKDADSEEVESEEKSDSESEKRNKTGLASGEYESSDGSDDNEEEEVEIDRDTSSTTDSDEEDEVSSEGEDTFFQEENVPEIDNETHRLAVVNMDWNQVKAVDLFVLLSSFLPKHGQILSVSVYPSDFGLKRMEEEAVHGPVGLFDDDKDKNEEEDDDDNDDIDNEKLRAYELSRLRYYYAVVECDSIATADYLYRNCDGVEFERSSNKLDLRFIPDSMEFKHSPRDVATEAPANYEGLDYHTQALQHSKINLSWDEDEPHRAKTLKRKFNADQLAELELKEFLASDESESDEDEDNAAAEDKADKKHKKKDMYRALIQSGDGSDGDEADEGEDMEVTFNTGLEDISKRILEKKDKETETVWEAYLRKRKEKKKARKNRSKNSSDDDSSDTDHKTAEEPDDFFVEEPSIEINKGSSSKKRKHNKLTDEEAEASRAELELLLADDKGVDTNLKGYNLKRKKAEGKKGKEITDEGKIPTVDYDDSRFSALFTSPLFALDPTDPQFKRSAAYARQVVQKQHQDNQENVSQKAYTEFHRNTDLSYKVDTDHDIRLQADTLSKKGKHELSSLVRSIKMKAKQLPLPSNDKVSRKRK